MGLMGHGLTHSLGVVTTTRSVPLHYWESGSGTPQGRVIIELQGSSSPSWLSSGT